VFYSDEAVKAGALISYGASIIAIYRRASGRFAGLGGDATDEVWRWFLLSGPHGPHFTWGQTRSQPAGHVGVEHLQRIIAEKEARDAGFPDRARAIALLALSSSDPSFIRRAIQVAAVVGGEAELHRIAALTTHALESVASDARASAFHLKKRLKGLSRRSGPAG